MTKAAAAPKVATVPNPVEFRYVGPGHFEDIPAEDLTPHMVDRAAYVQSLADGVGLIPGEPGFADVRARVVARINLSGHYAATAPIPAPVADVPDSAEVAP